MTIGRKLLFGGVCLVFIPMVLVGWYSYYSGSKYLTQTARERTAETARHLADLVQVVLEDEIKLMRDLSVGNTTLRVLEKVDREGVSAASKDVADLDRKLKNFMKELGAHYETIFVTDSKGLILSDGVGGGYKGLSVADRAYFIASMQGKPSAGDIVRSKKTENPVVMASAPIYDSRGKILGAVCAAMKMDFWEEKVAKVKLGGTGYSVLIGEGSLAWPILILGMY